ncbi:MAG: Lrp/AsnC ligand binding domain-containing protein [Candidatus Thorarchaeota archaeon]|nr:Lrp/AsnC ligand binding domain-containing protein [Candidatus Thorarchaeota archaeon]MCK5238721.1 Lrp/AsnC ligand binding domain-containing protein [Candidatus Thorarchaeota archaeon]
MVKAYVLIKTVNGVENEVLRQILELSVTEEAHLTFGLYDIIAEVKGRDMETLVEIITMKIRPIEGITDTQSLMAIDAEIDMSSTSLAS